MWYTQSFFVHSDRFFPFFCLFLSSSLFKHTAGLLSLSHIPCLLHSQFMKKTYHLSQRVFTNVFHKKSYTSSEHYKSYDKNRTVYICLQTNDNESLAVEIINKKTKNVIVHALYRPPCGKIKPFKKYLKKHSKKINLRVKQCSSLATLTLKAHNHLFWPIF